MNCVICGSESSTKTCSGSCRAKLSRRTRTDGAQAHAHGVPVLVSDKNGNLLGEAKLRKLADIVNNPASQEPRQSINSEPPIVQHRSNGDRKYYVNELSSIDCNEPRTEPQRQHYIQARNKATRDRLRVTPIETLRAENQFIPVWREAQG